MNGERLGHFVGPTEVVVAVEDNPDGIGKLVAIYLPAQGVVLTMSTAKALEFSCDVASAAIDVELHAMAAKIRAAEGAER